MKKIKLCLACPGCIENKKLWSGTYWALYVELSQRDDVILSVLEYDVYNDPVYKYIYNPIRKLIYTWNSPQDFFVRSIIKRSIRKGLREVPQNQDYYLFPAYACPNHTDKRLDGKIIVYTDSLMVDLNRYRGYRVGKFLLSAIYSNNIVKDYRAARMVFTQNEWSKQRFVEYAGISPSNVYNVGFGVNLKFYEGEKDYSQQLLLIVLRKGAEWVKGLKLLCKALPLIRKRYPMCRLAVVGTDYGKGMDGVDTYYNMPRSTTVELFSKCTLYVMPAEREPNGITYLEGLANKAPIVGLDKFAFPEFTGFGQWGFISKSGAPEDVADTICDALCDVDRLKTYGMRGQAFVKDRYVWAKTVDLILQQLQ